MWNGENLHFYIPAQIQRVQAPYFGGEMRTRQNPRLRRSFGYEETAFTRVDLLVSIVLIAFLSVWFWTGFLGERGRTAKCASTLSTLGKAMQEFASDHADALPPASIDPPGLAWDTQIAPYLPRKLVENGMDPMFVCPSDKVARSRPRSYAMPAYNMQPENWPPGADVSTGVGLIWNKNTIRELLDSASVEKVATNTDFLAMVKRQFILSPVNTMVLTEWMHPENNLKSTKMAAISGNGQQLELLINKKTRIHKGRFGYLMLDGHVELLSPLQASQVWSISKSE
jgi:prepilin-type processing-associated H-X9-DG protein